MPSATNKAAFLADRAVTPLSEAGTLAEITLWQQVSEAVESADEASAPVDDTAPPADEATAPLEQGCRAAGARLWCHPARSMVRLAVVLADEAVAPRGGGHGAAGHRL